MGYSFPPDVERLISDWMATGRFASLDDVLREALQSVPEDSGDDWNAIEQALADWNAGDRGLPLREAFAEVRGELNLDARQ